MQIIAAGRMAKIAARFAWSVLLALSAAVAMPAQARTTDTLGPGDEVKITVFQRPELATETRVTNAGKIAMPLIGEVAVSGLTAEQAGQRIAERLKKGQIVVNPQVTFTFSRVPVFYIYGEVQRAGAYKLEPRMTVVQAISVGGGVTPRGTERRPKIRRTLDDGTVKEINAELTDRLQADDVVYVRESLF